MSPEDSPFRCVWLFSELKGYRELPKCSTYFPFPYRKLPPLPDELFDGDLEWLASEPVRTDIDDDAIDYFREYSESLQAEAIELGVVIPRSFRAFFANPDLIRRVRSCTDAYFEFSGKSVTPFGNGYLIRFLADSQDVCFWNLFLTRSGDHCVVSSWEDFAYYASAEFRSLNPAKKKRDASHVDFMFCAPSFESFIYRFWIENEIWFRLSYDKEPLTTLQQQRYVNHYTPKH